MPNAVFVYGTLKQGQCRASMWPVTPTTVQPAWVRGALFGRDDYPALRPGDDKVLGELWQFPDDQMAVVIERTDRIEGTNQPRCDDLYLRLIVEVFDTAGAELGKAYTYHYAQNPHVDGFHLIRPAAPDAYVAWPAAE